MKKLLMVLLLLPVFAFSRSFYFSSVSGNDTTGTGSITAPYRSLKKMEQLARTAGFFLPGDTIRFKRGEVFANGYANGYSSVQWTNIPGSAYWICPSGTEANPIVITNYGEQSADLPNWLYPTATYPVSKWPNTREGRAVIKFSGVHDIIIDGIQSNEYRVPEADKANPGYTGGWILGAWTNGSLGDSTNSYHNLAKRDAMVTRLIVRNCKFNNTTYGIQQFAGIDSKVTNCIFTNFKSSADTSGTNDVLAGAMEGIWGIRCEFSYNYIKGAWAKSGRISSTHGLGGVAFDMFDLYNSKVCYNTIIDCDGAFELGSLDRYDTAAGCQYDTIAFNKVINCGQFAYIHNASGFSGNTHHLAIWNNVLVSNEKDRFIGNGYGKDVYGDGQGFAPGTTQPWWFCRNPYSTWNVAQIRPIITTTAGSNVITVSSAAGISVGSVFFMDNDSLLGANYQTVTVTAINGTSLTLSVPCTQTRTQNLAGSNYSGFHLPIADQTWSLPENAAFNNWSNHRAILQITSDTPKYGRYVDTTIDLRNNAFYWTTGTQGIYNWNRIKRSANLYYPRGGTSAHATSLGGTINYRGTLEQLITTGTMFFDTTQTYPENWSLDLFPSVTGVPIQGFTKDFAGTTITSNFIGLYQPILTTPLSAVASIGQIACYNGSTTLTITASGGVPPYSGTGPFTVSAGPYSKTVTDANGGSFTVTGTVSQPTQLVASSTVGAITCAGGSGTITVSATGGTAPYSGTGVFTVTSGTYTYTVTDANGCTAQTTNAISDPPVVAAPTTTGGAICGAGTVRLTATAPIGCSIEWYTASSGGSSISTTTTYTTPSISTTTTYYAQSKNASGCVSPTRTAAVATINEIPSAPVAVSVPPACLTTTTTTVAVTVSVTLPVSCIVKWYQYSAYPYPFDSTLGSLTRTLSATTTYYAETMATVTKCKSATRTPVVATVLSPTITYSDWSTCTNGVQTRTYTRGYCPVPTPPADSLSRTCTNVVISVFKFNPGTNANIQITSNLAGTMLISTASGTPVKTQSYAANGATISVKTLAPGQYVATTYGRTLSFTR